uniref:Potassium channel tetramerization domain containing 19 n=1 Tax=Aquila chrysaetos chrysaetos TaxID=223781 RepID=A0A663DY58_AQUCH
VDTPLLDTEDEVNYCFLPLDLVAKYPVLVNDNNLLWLLENAALIECKCSEFRFIVNFLCSEKMLLPYDFSNIDALEEEALILGIPELIDAVKIYRGSSCSVGAGGDGGAVAGESPPRCPLYTMVLGLLANYLDSALGQLCMGSDLGRSRLHLSGDSILFQHARNWLGTCRLPLSENISEIKDLCAYLDKRDATYEPMKDALKCKMRAEPRLKYIQNWTAEVSVCSLHQIVKFYVGSNWYETCLQTLVKYPELLSNDKKVCWITYGQNLLIHGDGQMFRHVLNFLRLGKLFLPAEFKEWPLFCQEAEEYQIPSLLEALYHSDAYRLWIQTNELCNKVSFPCRRSSTVSWNEENEFSKDPKEVRFGFQNMESKRPVGQSIPKLFCGLKGQSRGIHLEDATTPQTALVNSSYYKHLVSPPRKRGMRSTLTKKVESKDSASHIQKLISLVKEWDVVNCKRCDFSARFAVKLNLNSFTETRDRLILKVEQPPVLDNDGFCISNEESVVCLQHSGMAANIVFLTFAHFREEIFYARKCHFFLTDVRLKDPKEITAKVGTLMNRLWTQQIMPRKFVADLLDTEYFQGDRNVHEELLQWVEVSSMCHQVMLYSWAFFLPNTASLGFKLVHCSQFCLQSELSGRGGILQHKLTNVMNSFNRSLKFCCSFRRLSPKKGAGGF